MTFLSRSSSIFLSSSIANCENDDCPCGKSYDFSGEHIEKIEEDESKDSDACEEENIAVEKLPLWETILKESQDQLAPFYEWLKEHESSRSEEFDDDGPVEYLNRTIFPVLLPAMEKMLVEAKRCEALEVQKYRFNGIDYLAEYLWNKNPQHPERQFAWLQVLEIPTFKLWLKEHPRPTFPKSWLWSKEEAALIIQRCIRGWLVRKREDVQELRQFWKALAAEKAEVDSKLIQVTVSELFISKKKSPNN